MLEDCCGVELKGPRRFFLFLYRERYRIDGDNESFHAHILNISVDYGLEELLAYHETSSLLYSDLGEAIAELMGQNATSNVFWGVLYST